MDALYEFLDLLIYKLCSLLTVWLSELETTRSGRVIVRNCTDLVAHTIISHHAVCHLGQALKVIEKHDGINIYEAGQKVNIVLNPRDVMSYEPGEEEAEV